MRNGNDKAQAAVPGEEQFQRRGVFYGNIQDCSSVQGMAVAVIGGGNSAVQIVENLHTVAEKIHLISDYSLTADRSILDHIKSYRNIHIYENIKVLEFTGGKKLGGVTLREKDSGEIMHLAVQGVFISIGSHPNSGLLNSIVEMNHQGEIIIESNCTTSCPGIFAAGDVTNAFGKRIVIASGEGAKAALALRQFILKSRERKQND
jgi:alkyl hydroperoxide reductase subunit F